MFSSISGELIAGIDASERQINKERQSMNIC